MSEMPNNYPSNNYPSNYKPWKSAMELPEEPMSQAIKDKIVEVVAYIKSIDRDKLEARLVKEDKVIDPYKVFACKKKDPPKEETPKSNLQDDLHCYRQNNYPYQYVGEYPLEDQCGPNPEAAIEKFFSEAVKTLGRQKKNKEKEFAKLEKDIASLDYLVERIKTYANEDARKELLDKEPENVDTKSTIPVPPSVPETKPSVTDTQPLPALTLAEANKILSM